MKNLIPLSLLFITFSCGEKYYSGGTNLNGPDTTTVTKVISEPILICIRNADFEPAFINEKGDTVIPFGKYPATQTDTLKKFGIVLTHEFRWIGIDQADHELFEFFMYDNGPDYFVEGLARIEKDGKTGFVNESGEVVIEPQFAFANPFENGKAEVTLSGTKITEGEHWYWQSDDWFYIDTTGKRID